MKKKLFKMLSLTLVLTLTIGTTVFAAPEDETQENPTPQAVETTDDTNKDYIDEETAEPIVSDEEVNVEESTVDASATDETTLGSTADIIVQSSTSTAFKLNAPAPVNEDGGDNDVEIEYKTIDVMVDFYEMADGELPEEVTIELYVTDADGTSRLYDSVTESVDSFWESSLGLFLNVPLNDADGNALSYHATIGSNDVKEGWDVTTSGSVVNGFAVSIVGNAGGNNGPGSEPESETVSINGSVLFNDDITVDELKINLYNDLDVIDAVTVSEENEWGFSFENLPRLDDENNEIFYDVTIDDSYMQEGWICDLEVNDGYYTFVISLNADTGDDDIFGSISGYVEFDMDEKDIPDSLKVALFYDELDDEDWVVEELSLDGDWEFEFAEVLLVDDEGNPLPYYVSVMADDIAENWEIVKGDADNGYVITIKGNNDDSGSEEETVSINGTISFRNGITAEEMKVNLYNGTDVVDTVTVTQSDKWDFSFKDLPKKDDSGNEIRYNVAIDDSSMQERWVSSVEVDDNFYSFVITLEDKAFGSIKGHIEFDMDDKDVPDYLYVALYRDDAEDKDDIEVERMLFKGGWNFEFEKVLFVDANGNPLSYYVSVLEVIDGDISDDWEIVKGDDSNGYVITIKADANDGNTGGDNAGDDNTGDGNTGDNGNVDDKDEADNKDDVNKDDTSDKVTADFESEGPKTGDNSMVTAWMLLGLMSLCVGCYIVVSKKKIEA